MSEGLWIAIAIVAVLVVTALVVGFVRYRRSRISLSAPEETPKLDRSGGYTASSGITFSSSDTAEKLPTVGDDAEIPRDSRKRTIADVQLPEPEVVAEPEVGQIYTGKVVKLVDFGAFVNFFGKRDGLVHVSQIANKRLTHPNEILKEGQEVKVKLLGFDERGKVRLGMKMVDQETGAEIVETKEAPAEA